MPRQVSQPVDEPSRKPRRRPARADAVAAAADLPGLAAAGPELRDAVLQLAAECERLRDELGRARDRIASLERLADEDALTPVANRRAFMRQLTQMLAFTQRYGVPASVVYFDVNNMKQINDAYGHSAGDAALLHIAEVLLGHIRSSDVVGRLGGDEFGVILAQTDEAQAHHKATALAEAVAATPLRWGDRMIPMSAAWGVHVFTGRDDPQRAIEAADRAMYRRKRTLPHAEIEPET